MIGQIHLTDFINDLRRKGRYLFHKQEAAQEMNLSESALKASLARLSGKRKIGFLKDGLYQILPEEYAFSGSLPPQWFINELMSHLEIPYYTGLLSAAALHGAAHQAPQIFQVICPRQLRPLTIGNTQVHFYFNKDFSLTPTQDYKTPTGYLKVSTPEGTAFDLLRYLHQSGHLNHVATVLSELADTLDKDRLLFVAEKISLRYVQRLGYVLDSIGAASLTTSLHTLVLESAVRYVPLRADAPIQRAEKNKKWHILVNERVETDL